MKSITIHILGKIQFQFIICLKQIYLQKGSETHEIKKPNLYLNFILQEGYLIFQEKLN